MAGSSQGSSSQVKTQVIKDAAWYVPSSYIAQVLGMINGFIMRYLLGPAPMGIWSIIQMVVGYGSYFYLGSTAAGAKEIPFYRAKKDSAMAQNIQDNIFGMSVVISFALLAVLFLVCLFGGRFLSFSWRMGLGAAGILLTAQRFYTFYIMLLRGHKDFRLLSKVVVVTAVLDIALTALLTKAFGLYGLLAAVVGSMILSIFYIIKYSSFRVGFAWDPKIIWKVSRVGLPMLIYGLLFTFLRSLDKLTILKFMDLHDVGLYSIAMMANNYSLGFASMIAIILLPHFSAKFATAGEVKAVGSYLTQATEVIAHALPAALGVMYFMIPFLVRCLLKKYVDGIPALQIMIFGSFFLSLVHQPNMFLLSIDKQVWMVPACVLGIAATGAMLWFVGMYYPSLEYIAAAVCLGNALYVCVLLGTCLRKFMRGRAMLAFAMDVLLPFLYCIVTTLVIDRAFVLHADWLDTLAKTVLMTIASLYPLWRIDKRTGVVRRALHVVAEKWNKMRA